MKAKNLEDVVVYREAVEVANAISSLLERPVFGKHFDTKDQLGRSSRRVAPLIAEGFGQLTDRHVASYLGRARGSAHESRVHLQEARSQGLLSQEECAAMSAKYITIGKRLTRWIQHLRRSDWTDRG
jgi:four helix bundle protein